MLIFFPVLIFFVSGVNFLLSIDRVFVILDQNVIGIYP